jgi:AraC family transcriptional regulator
LRTECCICTEFCRLNFHRSRSSHWTRQVTSSSIPVTSGSGSTTSAEVNGFRVTDVRFPPLVTLADHSHERACLAVVVEGDVDKAFRHAALPSPAATVLTMPPLEPHVDRFGRAGARIVVVEPDDATVERLRCVLTSFDRVDHFRDLGAVAVATRLAHEVEAEDGAARLAVEGLVLELLARVARAPDRPSRRPPAWLREATDFVQARFRESFRVTDVACAVGVHPVHLARVFRLYHGRTIGEEVRGLRIDWAAVELSRSERSLAEIAFDAGFADQSHFTRAFKARTGVTPGRYRETARG